MTGSAVIAFAPIVPALVFFALGWLGQAPGEWGGAALTAWTVLLSALIAGAGLKVGGGILVLFVPVIGLTAIMTGGPAGLAVAAICSLFVFLAGPEPTAGRWTILVLFILSATLALRQHLS